MRCFNVPLMAFAVMTAPMKFAAAQAAIPLVDIKSVDPTILVELRYAGRNNLTGHPLYPLGTRALVRPEVASRLSKAKTFLRHYQYRLKIWDAYRPVAVQVKLWQAVHNNDYVANPETGAGSLHSWGLAVDATLVDAWNRPVRMPTDFDDFTPAAMWHYAGPDFEIRSHVHLLQIAMRNAGFYGLPTEWWHFTIANWQEYLPPEKAKQAAQVCETHWQDKL
ncbi:MAG: peptidase M15 [Verrucomicrobia bacterium]|nr:MAG: peptidase M15 [Verrucomicrobiota bacterium]